MCLSLVCWRLKGECQRPSVLPVCLRDLACPCVPMAACVSTSGWRLWVCPHVYHGDSRPFPRPTLDLCTSQKVKSRLQGTDHACSPYAVKASYQVPNRHSTTTTSHPSGHCQPNPKGGRVPGPSSQRGMGEAAEMTGRSGKTRRFHIQLYKRPVTP